MQEVVWQEGESIEIIVWDDLTVDEFKQVIHQLESMCTAHPKIKVMLDAGGLESAEFKIIMEEYDFYKKYKNHLERVAVVTDSRFEAFMTGIFDKFAEAEFRVFPNAKTNEARKWVFPSRLPG